MTAYNLILNEEQMELLQRAVRHEIDDATNNLTSKEDLKDLRTLEDQMRIQFDFRTQKEAIRYLEQRGWIFYRKSLGEKLFVHKTEQMGGRVITQLKNRKWRIKVI